MADRVADLVQAELARGIGSDGHAECAVSGGSTPEALYRTLVRRDVPWGKVGLTLVDERWTPPDHPRSNETFVRRSFEGAPIRALRGLYRPAPTPADALAQVEASLADIGKPFDVVILGIGPDGHSASWFPHAHGLSTALASKAMVATVRAIRSDVTQDEVDRMTLTVSAVASARRIVLLLAGMDKRAAFEAARGEGPVEAMPVRAILRTRPDLWACWAP